MVINNKVLENRFKEFLSDNLEDTPIQLLEIQENSLRAEYIERGFSYFPQYCITIEQKKKGYCTIKMSKKYDSSSNYIISTETISIERNISLESIDIVMSELQAVFEEFKCINSMKTHANHTIK